jgi:hypothetical protein
VRLLHPLILFTWRKINSRSYREFIIQKGVTFNWQ